MPLSDVELSKEDAAGFLLNYHNLDHPKSLTGKESVLRYIRKVGCIQYDPLNVCGQNPDLVLQSRIAGYDQNWLKEALYAERSLIDGWDKMMAISSVEDWSFLRRLREQQSNSYISRYSEVKHYRSHYLKAVRDNGPLSSLYFKDEKKINWAWGSSRLAKAALESLFFGGEISIHHREHTRRVYDLTQRLLPESILSSPDPFPTEQDYQKAHIFRRISSAGIAGFSSRDFWYGIAGCDMKGIREIIQILLEEGKIKRLVIEGSTRDWLVPSRNLEDYMSTGTGKNYGDKAVLLGALDNIMWNRELIEDIFSFKYRWEVYTPASKREYGYYVLPLLYRGRLIGRCEPYLDRKSNRLLLKGLWLEKDVVPAEETVEALRFMFSDFCRFLRAGRMATTPAVGRPFRTAFKGITSSGG